MRLAVQRKLTTKVIAEEGAIHKAEQRIDTNSPDVVAIDVMLVACLPKTGAVFSDANVWKPPMMRKRDVEFRLGVCASKDSRVFGSSVQSEPFRAISSQDTIVAAVKKDPLEGPAIRSVNPFTLTIVNVSCMVFASVFQLHVILTRRVYH